MNALSLEEAEQRIYAIYQFFAREAPGVTPQLQGELLNLWNIVWDFEGTSEGRDDCLA